MRALALTGDWDIVCFGHDHKPAIALVATIGGGRTLLINPGTVGGIGATPTYVLCDLADLSCTLREIDAH
jgi:uncharacterized protein